jgi:hypothetical protein
MVYQKPTNHIERVEHEAGAAPGLPGIPEHTGAPYKAIFFGAQRDWPNDEVGWTKIPRTKTVRRGDQVWAVRVNRRDINRLEKRAAGWNLLDVDS